MAQFRLWSKANFKTYFEWKDSHPLFCYCWFGEEMALACKTFFKNTKILLKIWPNVKLLWKRKLHKNKKVTNVTLVAIVVKYHLQ